MEDAIISTKFNMTRDVAGYNGFGLMFADDNYSLKLAQNVEQTITVPDNYPYWLAIFTIPVGNSVWVAVNATAVFPTGAASATTSQQNPTARLVKAGDVLHIITNDTNTPLMGVEFYVAPTWGN